MAQKCIATLLAFALLTACSGSTGGNKAADATLPEGWPIPELTLPNDAIEHVLAEIRGPIHGRSNEPSEYYFPETGGETVRINKSSGSFAMWTVGFATTHTWDEVLNHIKDDLAPLKYEQVKDYAPGDSEGSNMGLAAFLSPEGQKLVTVKCRALPLGSGIISEGYELSVMLTPTKLDPERITE